ncbi:hypothetical protein QJQ45_016207 [Haematococcus lacustris]|nr:hypothetical protein QJQ45_016207 [Haematococcus lacustris]
MGRISISTIPSPFERASVVTLEWAAREGVRVAAELEKEGLQARLADPGSQSSPSSSPAASQSPMKPQPNPAQLSPLGAQPPPGPEQQAGHTQPPSPVTAFSLSPASSLLPGIQVPLSSLLPAESLPPTPTHTTPSQPLPKPTVITPFSFRQVGKTSVAPEPLTPMLHLPIHGAAAAGGEGGDSGTASQPARSPTGMTSIVSKSHVPVEVGQSSGVEPRIPRISSLSETQPNTFNQPLCQKVSFPDVHSPLSHTTSASFAIRQASATSLAAGGQQPSQPISRSTSDRWSGAVKSVSTMHGVSRQFRTLRDMHMPTTIPREALKVIRVLGKGAFAIVEECVYRPAGGKPMLVAVKRLKPDLTQSEVDVVGMVREVALLRRLQNQHIVEFLGYGHWHWSKPPSLQPALGNKPGPCGLDPAVQQQASLFIVEELVDGGSLRAVVARQMRHAREGRVYRAEDAMRWLMQMAQGLKYLHQAQPQVIHRDLKLENILLKGKNPCTAAAKIADFGLSALVNASDGYRKAVANPNQPLVRPARARRASATDLDGVWAAAAANRTVALNVLNSSVLKVAGAYEQLSGRTGTLMYMAPEVYRQEPYNEKADVYSFAVLMYELLHRYMMISATDGSIEECQVRRMLTAAPEVSDPLWTTASLNRCCQTLPAVSAYRLLLSLSMLDPAQRPSMADLCHKLSGLEQALDWEKVDRVMVGGEAMQLLGNVVAPRILPQPPCSSQAATQPAASEPRLSTHSPAKHSKRTKAEQAAEPVQPPKGKGKGKGKGKAAKAKPAPQPGRWLDRDCNAAVQSDGIQVFA